MRIERIRKRLLQRQQDLLTRFQDELARAAEELDSRETEEVEHATELWDARVLSLLGDADVESLRRIAAAVRRLDEGRYGCCVECGVGIEPARLFVLPEAATCFDCALDAEQVHAPRLAM